jgi:DNA topoisomerase 2-associated protein PAT1
VRTLAEIEEEMRMNARQPQALASRLTPQLREASPQLHDQSPRMAHRASPQITHPQVQQIQQRSTPPPRMHPHAQSPRFHQLQQEILIQQQHHQLEEQRHLVALHERLQLEELQRQARAQQLQQVMQQDQLRRLSPAYARQNQDSYLNEADAVRRLQQMRIADEAQGLRGLGGNGIGGNGLGGNTAMLNSLEDEHALLNGAADLMAMQQSIQRQQRLLSEAAQADFLRQQGFDQGTQEELRQDALRRIVQAEQLEEKRRRKHNKIAHMVYLSLSSMTPYFNADFAHAYSPAITTS